jgi:ankyrin repeat protein
LAEGEDINGLGGDYGETPLMAASRTGKLAIVKFLVSNNADINARGKYDDTALMAAAWFCQKEILEYLLERGAEVNFYKYASKASALDFAAGKCRNVELVELLLEHGGNIHTKNKYSTPLINAVKSFNKATVKVLLDAGARMNERDNLGWTALMYAASEGHNELVSLLIDRNAEVNSDDRFGNSALSLAQKNGHSDIVELLINAGAIENTDKLIDKLKEGFRPVYLPTH